MSWSDFVHHPSPQEIFDERKKEQQARRLRQEAANWRTIYEHPGFSTWQLAVWATNWGTGDGDYCWESIADSREEAKAYYESIEDERDGDQLRQEASRALAWGGWTRDSINFRRS